MIHIFYHNRHKYFILNNYDRQGKTSKFMYRQYFKPGLLAAERTTSLTYGD